jgi:hypothetical protein
MGVIRRSLSHPELETVAFELELGQLVLFDEL